MEMHLENNFTGFLRPDRIFCARVQSALSPSLLKCFLMDSEFIFLNLTEIVCFW